MTNEDEEKLFFLSQVRYLDEQLERAQLGCDEVKKQNKDMITKLSALQEDTVDILDYLHYSLTEWQKKEEELREHLEQQLQADQQETKDLQLQINQEEEELQEEAGELRSQLKLQAATLEDLEQQSEQLKQLLLHRNSVQKDLDRLHQRQKEETLKLQLEDRKVTDEKKTEARSCMEGKVSVVVQEERTQNQQMVLELNSLIQQCTFRTSEKSRACGTIGKTSSKLNKMRSNYDKIQQKVFNLQQESERMTKRNKLLKKEIKNLISSHHNTLEKNEADRQLLASVTEDYHQRVSVISQLEAELQRKRRNRKKVEADIQKAVSIIRNPDPQLNTKTLLKVLEIIEPQETESPLQESTEQIHRGPEPQTSKAEAAASSETVTFDPDPLFLLADPQRCDPSLKPGPTQKQKAPPTGSAPPSHREKLPVKSDLWRQKLEKWINEV